MSARKFDGLTPAEAQVVELLAAGYKQVEIAEVLGKSEATVWQQVESARVKFGARTPEQLIALWLDPNRPREPKITLNLEGVENLLRRKCEEAGSIYRFAKNNKICEDYISNVLRGADKPGPGILLALGLRKKIVYEPK